MRLENISMERSTSFISEFAYVSSIDSRYKSTVPQIITIAIQQSVESEIISHCISSDNYCMKNACHKKF
jgi:hypothetical protein